jgi:hypothetical protein
MRLKILVFVDHAIIVRHFVDSGAFSQIVQAHDVRFVALPEDHKRIKGADLSGIPGDRLLRLPECMPRSAIWTRIFQIEILRNGGAGQARALADHHRNAIGRKAAWLYAVLGLPVVWPVYRGFLLSKVRKLRNRPLEELLEREKPDVILHPTVLAGAYINDLVDICRSRGIPLVGIMNSWDNPSTKRATVGHLDWLLVWGEQTKDHAIRYMRMAPETVVRFGAAQLDLYREAPRVPRERTRAAYAVPPGGRILLYAGSSKGSDEYQHLEFLEGAIEAGKLPNLVVVYRPHPWGDCGKNGGRISAKRWKHVRFEKSMVRYIEAAGCGKQPLTTPDYRDTHDILAATDILVSPVSTILLEASLNGIPNICLIDDIDADNWFMEVSTRLEHLREYFETPEFLVAKSTGELVPKVEEALALLDDSAAAGRVKAAARYFVDGFAAPYAERLRAFVEDLFAADKPHRETDYLVADSPGSRTRREPAVARQ